MPWGDGKIWANTQPTVNCHGSSKRRMQLWARAPLINRSAKATALQAKHAAGAACTGRQATAGLSARQLTAATTGRPTARVHPERVAAQAPIHCPAERTGADPPKCNRTPPRFFLDVTRAGLVRPFGPTPSTKHYRFFYKGSFINLRQLLLRSLPV
jgi:hypothetical protein